MASIVPNLQSWAGDYIKRNSDVEASATLECLKRFRILAVVAVFTNASYAYTFWFIGMGDGSIASDKWAYAIGLIHCIAGCIFSTLGVCAHVLLQKKYKHLLLCSLTNVLFIVTAMSFAVALAVVDQWVTNSTTNFATISLLIAVAALLRPAVSIPVYLLSYSVFYFALTWTVPDPYALAIARSQAMGPVIISIVSSVVLWGQYSHGVLLSAQLVRSNQVLAQKQEELETLATRDSLTGLLVRREFSRLADIELGRAAREGLDTSVLIIDLDFFKKINDNYGHPAGDEVLRQVGNLIKNNVRVADVVARLGGEEFIVLMPSTGRDGALSVAEKLRTQVSARPLVVNGGTELPVTASVGVCHLKPGESRPLDMLYAAADEALYAAKQRGRNRVEIAEIAPLVVAGEAAPGSDAATHPPQATVPAAPAA